MDSKPLMLICIYNDKSEKDAFLIALSKNSTPDKVSTLFFNNTLKNEFNPYHVLSKSLNSKDQDYILFCHQDIRFTSSSDYSSLIKMLKELTKLHPNWAVAGAGGISSDYKFTSSILDPHNLSNMKTAFTKAISLDECFLIINCKNFQSYNPPFNSFHFYGSDLCLTAILNGYEAYILNFPIQHLSKGKIDVYYAKCATEFSDYWSSHFKNVLYYNSVGTYFWWGKSKLVKKIFRSVKCTRFVIFILRLSKIFKRISPYSTQSVH